MEKISENPLLILDGAHNPAAFKALLKNISNSSSEFKNIHFIFSVLKNKDLTAILDQFVKFNLNPKFYLAENNSFRTIRIKDLAAGVKSKNFSYQTYNNLIEASRAAFKKAGADDLIVAAGSFNTVFEAGVEFMSKKIRGGKDEKK
jgi:dihydrofolate synthase/folylpolyglutamate synthase